VARGRDELVSDAIANGSAGLDGEPRVRTAVDALQEAIEMTAPTEVTDRSLPHGRGGDENLFNPEQEGQTGGGQGTEAMDPYAASLLRRVAPRLHGPVRREVTSAMRTVDAIALEGAPRPAHSSDQAHL
jgi:hypothetical protein